MAERPVEYAQSLDSAGPKSLVFIDRKGRVRSNRYRVLAQVPYYSVVSTLIVLEGFLGYAAFGWAGLSIAAGLGLFFAHVVSTVFSVRRALTHTVNGELEAAAALLNKLRKRRLIPRKVRGRVFGTLATVLNMQGKLEEALAANREAIRLYRRWKNPFATLARYGEVNLLARLGRVVEARGRFDELPAEVPDGEVLKLAHLTTELLLWFHEGRHELDDSQLHERAAFALGITVAAPTLGLLAWAFDQSGDAEMAELMESEARDRPGRLLEKRLPEVAEWLDERSNRRADELAVGARVRVESMIDDELELDATSARSKRRRRS